MTLTGGKRKANPALKAWVKHVASVAKAENISYGKEAMIKAKTGKYLTQWNQIKATLNKNKKGGSTDTHEAGDNVVMMPGDNVPDRSVLDMGEGTQKNANNYLNMNGGINTNTMTGLTTGETTGSLSGLTTSAEMSTPETLSAAPAATGSTMGTTSTLALYSGGKKRSTKKARSTKKVRSTKKRRSTKKSRSSRRS